MAYIKVMVKTEHSNGTVKETANSRLGNGLESKGDRSKGTEKEQIIVDAVRARMANGTAQKQQFKSEVPSLKKTKTTA